MSRAVNNFDDEQELQQHMQEKHVEVIERIKGWRGREEEKGVGGSENEAVVVYMLNES